MIKPEVADISSVAKTLPPTPTKEMSATSASEADMKKDIARILEETKLPERRGKAPEQKATVPPPSPQPIRTTIKTPEQSLTQKQEHVEKHAAGLTKEMTSRIGEGTRIITPEGMVTPFTPQAIKRQQPGVPIRTVPPHTMEKVNATPPAVATEKAEEKDIIVQRPSTASLRTLKDDLRELVSVRKMSLVHAATLESERRKKGTVVDQAAVAARAGRMKRLLRFFAIVALLLLLGGAALFAMLVVQSERSENRTPDFGTSFIFSEQTLSYPVLGGLAPREIQQQLSQSRFQGNLSLGAMERIVPTIIEMGGVERTAYTQEFMNAIAPTAPDELIRTVDNDFFFGVHTEGENVPIFIFSVSQYENAFAAMLSWERTMNEDLSPLFTRVFHQELDERGAPIVVRFEDASIRNYDVRALKNQQGEVKMLYAFPSRTILIITESPHALVEALARLRAERRL